MNKQISVIREALELATDGPIVDRNGMIAQALAALTQLEAMVGEPYGTVTVVRNPLCVDMHYFYRHPEPPYLDNAAECHTVYTTAPVAQQYEAGDVASASAQGFRDGVASVTQQPQKLEDSEQYRMRMAGISTAAMGYWKEGDPIHPDYDTPALRDVAKLYAKYDALYKAQQPQEIEVQCPVCNHKFHEWPNDKQPQAEAVWVNPELEHMAEEAECVSMCLNDRGVPSKDGSKPLSLWGRVQQYANPRFLGGMTTNTPIVSSEHIKSLAQVCRLIGNYTTTEFVQNVVGFAQVLLANKAVQEAFVKANTHLLYAAPQQAEAVPDGWYITERRDGGTAKQWPLTEQQTLAVALPQQAEAVPPEVTDAMALAFHRALTDGAIGQSEVEELKVGLRAALAAQGEKP